MARLIGREPLLVWDLVICHLITTAYHPSTPQQIRTQACESMDDIITSAMAYASEVGLEKDERIQMQLLVALSQLMDNSDRNAASGSVKGYYVEVQKMSLETLNKLLQTSGHMDVRATITSHIAVFLSSSFYEFVLVICLLLSRAWFYKDRTPHSNRVRVGPAHMEG